MTEKKKKTSGNPNTKKTKVFGAKSMIIIIIVWVDGTLNKHGN